MCAARPASLCRIRAYLESWASERGLPWQVGRHGGHRSGVHWLARGDGGCWGALCAALACCASPAARVRRDRLTGGRSLASNHGVTLIATPIFSPWQVDGAGNVLITRPGINGGEGEPAVILQAGGQSERGTALAGHLRK